jgi:hypothetical protein
VNPRAFATPLATVDFPAPAGPSIAITIALSVARAASLPTAAGSD